MIKISKESLDTFRHDRNVVDDTPHIDFLGNTYTLNQCEGDLFDWHERSKVGEYTRFYSHVVFHAENALYAAYADNLSNYIKI